MSENINEGAAEPITGNVGGNAGADGLDRVDWTGAEQGVIQGKYGTLTVSEDGSWSYWLDNANPAVMGLRTGEKLEDEIFSFKVYDKDGDHADSTLSITINGESHGITITPETPDPEVPADPDKPVDKDDATTQGASVSVNEANLPEGANPDADALARTGKIAIEAADGIKSITLGGTEIDLNGGLTDIPVENGILKVSYIDGELSYTFTLDKNAPHTEQGRDTLSQNLKLEIENLEGERKESTLRINITDDIPTAEDVSGEIGKGADEALTGSVIGSVTPGADGFKDSGNPVQWGTEAAKYGEFVHHEDGSWEYRVNNASETVMGLKIGETLTETFTYKVVDADGDMAEAELTVTIKGKTNAVAITPQASDNASLDADGNANISVSETNLSDGSAANPEALVKSGSFAIDSPDGVSAIRLGGREIPTDGAEATFTTGEGTVTASFVANEDGTGGTVNYTYTLTGNTTEHSKQGHDSLAKDLTLEVESLAGGNAESSLVVNIEDDAPELKPVETVDKIFLHAVDADGDSVVKEFSMNGENSDPTLPDGMIKASFTSNSLNHSLVMSENGMAGGSNPDSDANILNGRFLIGTLNSPDITAKTDIGWNFHFIDESDFSFKAWFDGENTHDAGHIAENENFRITVNSVVRQPQNGSHYYYLDCSIELKKPVDHDIASDMRLWHETWTRNDIVQSTTFVATVKVEDDTPLISMDGDTAHMTTGADNGDGSELYITLENGDKVVWQGFDGEQTDLRGLTTGATWYSADGRLSVTQTENGYQFANVGEGMQIANAFEIGAVSGNAAEGIVKGADADGNFEAGIMHGELGTFTINEDGTYTYTPDAYKLVQVSDETTVAETFTYTYRDADGDEIQGQVLVNVRGSGGKPSISFDTAKDGGDNPLTDDDGNALLSDTITVRESNLSDGTSPDAAKLSGTGSFTVDMRGIEGTVNVGGMEFKLDANGNIEGDTGALGIFEFNGVSVSITSVSGGKFEYSYSFDSTQTHDKQTADELLADVLKITASNKHGEISGQVEISVIDDSPEFTPDDVSGTFGHFSLNAGTDKLASLTVNGQQGTEQEDGSILFEFASGKLTLTETGNGGYDWAFEKTLGDAPFEASGMDMPANLNDAWLPNGTANTFIRIDRSGNDVPEMAELLPSQGQWYVPYETALKGWDPNIMFIIPKGTKNFVLNIYTNKKGTSKGENDIELFTMNGEHLAGTPLDDIVYKGSTISAKTDINSNAGRLGFTLDDYDGSHLNTGPTTYDGGNTLHFSSIKGMIIGYSGDSDRHDAVPNDGANQNWHDYEVLTIDEVTEDLILWTPGLGTSWVKYWADLPANEFTVTATDGDGDQASMKLTVNNDDVPQIIRNDGINVKESALENGTNPNVEDVAGTGTFIIDNKGNAGTLTIDGTDIAFDAEENGEANLTVQVGQATIEITSIKNGVVTYNYKLNGAENNEPDADSWNGTLPLSITTKAGSTTTALKVEVADDAPVVDVSEGDQVVAGQELTGTIDYSFGADDGEGKTVAVVVDGERHELTLGEDNSVEGKLGTLDIKADGRWTFHAKEDIAGRESFSIEVTDSDGDKALADGQLPSIDFEVLCKPDLVFESGYDVRVFESGLGTGTQAGLKDIGGTGSFRVDTKGVEGVLTIGGTEIALDANGNGSINGLSEFKSGNATLKITAIKDGVVSYTYKLAAAEDHPGSDSNVEDVISREIGISVTTKGGTDSTSMNLVIVDDAPELLPAEQASPMIWIHAVDSDGSSKSKGMHIGADAIKNNDVDLAKSTKPFVESAGSDITVNMYEGSLTEDTGTNRIFSGNFFLDYDPAKYDYTNVITKGEYLFSDGTSFSFDKPHPQSSSKLVLNKVIENEFFKFTAHSVDATYNSALNRWDYNLSYTVELKDNYDGDESGAVWQVVRAHNYEYWSASTIYSGYSYLKINIHDDAPTIDIIGDTANVDIGGDDGSSGKIEVSADESGTMKYVWLSPDGITTDLRGMNAGEKWSSFDGSVSVTLTEKGYQFDYHETASEDIPAQTFEIGVNASGPQTGDILTSIKQGADRDGYKVEWNIHDSDYGVFTADRTGKFTFTPNEDVRNEIKAGVTRTEKFSFIYTDGDGDQLTGEVAIKIAGTGIDDSDSNIAIKDNGDAGLEVIVTLGTPPTEDAIIIYEINGEIFTHTVHAGETGFIHEMERPKSAYELTDIKAEITGIEGGWEHALPGAVAQGWYVSDPAPIGIGLEMVDGDDAKAMVTVEYPPKNFGTITMVLDDGTSYDINLVPGVGEYELKLDHENLGTPYGTVNTAVFTVKGGAYSPQEVVEIDFDSFTLGTGANIVFEQDSDIVTATVMLDYVPREACEVSYEFAGGTYTVNLEAGQRTFTHEYLVQKGDAQHVELTITDIKGGGYAKPERGDSAAGDFQIFAPSIDFGEYGALEILESSLPDGTDPQERPTGSFKVNMNDVAGTLTIAGQEIAVDRYGNADVSGLTTIDTGRVLITVGSIENGVVNYTYELKEAQDHSENDTVSDKIEVKLETRAGESVANVDVSIVDDAPQYNPTLAPQQIFIHATDSDGDTLTKGMLISSEAVEQEDLSKNPNIPVVGGYTVYEGGTASGSGQGGSAITYITYTAWNQAKGTPFYPAGYVYGTLTVGGKSVSTTRSATKGVWNDPASHIIINNTEVFINKITFNGEAGATIQIGIKALDQSDSRYDPNSGTDNILSTQIRMYMYASGNGGNNGAKESNHYFTYSLVDDAPLIGINGDNAHVIFGADNGDGKKLEVSIDQEGSQKYQWQTPDGETTDISSMSEGDTWISTDGTVAVTLTAESYKFKLLKGENKYGLSDEIKLFELDANDLVSDGQSIPFENDIHNVINAGADRDGEQVRWGARGVSSGEFATEFGKFVVNEDGSWSFTPNADKVALLAKDAVTEQDLAFTYIDGDGDEISGTIRVNITGQNESENAVYPAESDINTAFYMDTDNSIASDKLTETADANSGQNGEYDEEGNAPVSETANDENLEQPASIEQNMQAETMASGKSDNTEGQEESETTEDFAAGSDNMSGFLDEGDLDSPELLEDISEKENMDLEAESESYTIRERAVNVYLFAGEDELDEYQLSESSTKDEKTDEEYSLTNSALAEPDTTVKSAETDPSLIIQTGDMTADGTEIPDCGEISSGQDDYASMNAMHEIALTNQ